MSTDQSVEVLVKALRTRAETTTTELILRELSFDSQRSIYSAVLMVRLHGRDKGYIWAEGKNECGLLSFDRCIDRSAIVYRTQGIFLHGW